LKMPTGTSLTGYLPVLSEPDLHSRMESQLLFGETCDITESRKDWYRIIREEDHLTGWVLGAAIRKLDPEAGLPEIAAMAVKPVTPVADLASGTRILVPAGACWGTDPETTWKWAGYELKILHPEDWLKTGTVADPEETGSHLLSVPCIPGGRCGMGIDSPGLLRLVGRAMGRHLPHRLGDQAAMGKILNFMEEVEKGDLVFFDNEEGEIIHGGIALGESRVLHAYGKVRIDRLDHQGIFNREVESYTHRLRLIRRPVS